MTCRCWFGAALHDVLRQVQIIRNYTHAAAQTQFFTLFAPWNKWAPSPCRTKGARNAFFQKKDNCRMRGKEEARYLLAAKGRIFSIFFSLENNAPLRAQKKRKRRIKHENHKAQRVRGLTCPYSSGCKVIISQVESITLYNSFLKFLNASFLY